MKKILFFISATLTLLSSSSSFHMQTYTTPIIQINADEAVIVDNPDIIIGSSGVVTHRFSNSDSSILARATVIKKEGLNAVVKLTNFDGLKQKALPEVGISPSVGDSVILNFLYSRAVVVAPNQEVYQYILNAFPNISFINPDIPASYLSTKYRPNPSYEEFKAICNDNGAGLIFFAVNNEGLVLDCQNFKKLQSFEVIKATSYQLPFYSNIKDIRSSILSLSSKEVSDYNSYYSKLIKDRN